MRASSPDAASSGGRRRWVLCALLAALLPGCGNSGFNTPTVRIDLSRTAPADEMPSPPHRGRLRFGIAGLMSPVATFERYRDLLGYLENQLDLQIDSWQRKTYQEINELLVRGRLDAAFLGAGGYARVNSPGRLSLVAVPEIRGRLSFRAYIIVRRDSPVQSFTGLRGRSFAFTDPLSASGWLYPVWKLARLGSNPDEFFSRAIYTYGHDRSIKAVVQGLVDAASVSSLVFDLVAERDPAQAARLRIIDRSAWMANPPVVVRSGLDPSLKLGLANALLEMHRNPEGRRILAGLRIDRFRESAPERYEPVKEMIRRVGPWNP